MSDAFKDHPHGGIKEAYLTLVEEMLANPDVVYPDMWKKLEDKLVSLESAVHHSTISPDHTVARSVQAFSKRMLKLSPTETKSYPHSIGSTITTLSTGSSTFTLAKLPLPTFKGDPLKCGIFWQSFSTNIHENSRLDDHQKEADISTSSNTWSCQSTSPQPFHYQPKSVRRSGRPTEGDLRPEASN